MNPSIVSTSYSGTEDDGANDRQEEPRIMTETESLETVATRLSEQFASRRNFLKTMLAASVGTSGAGLLLSSAHAQSTTTTTTTTTTTGTTATTETPATIFSIAATAERLAVTFYSNGVANAAALGLTGASLDAVKGFLIEEQIHELFFEANGGKALTSTFSFPQGAATFTSLANFIATQQQLEGAFDSAFIAAAYEFAAMNNPAVARIAVQIAMIEEGHRTVGRFIGGLDPAEDNAFAPQLVPNVGAAPAVLAAAGFLSPVAGNTYSYTPQDFTSASLAPVFANIMQQKPFAASATTPPTSATPYYGKSHHKRKPHHHKHH